MFKSLVLAIVLPVMLLVILSSFFFVFDFNLLPLASGAFFFLLITYLARAFFILLAPLVLFSLFGIFNISI